MKKTFVILFAFAYFAILVPNGILMAESPGDDGRSGEWAVAGQNLSNTRNQPSERAIGRSNAGALTPKWVFTTGAGVSATPTVAGRRYLFPRLGGESVRGQ